MRWKEEISAVDSLTFFLRKWLTILASGKKIPQTICAKSCINSNAQWDSTQPLPEAEGLQKTPEVVCLQEKKEVVLVLLTACRGLVWGARHAFLAGFAAGAQTFWRQHYQLKAFIPQLRTNLFPWFEVKYPSFGPLQDVFLEMQSRSPQNSASRIQNERHLFLPIFAPTWDIFL